MSNADAESLSLGDELFELGWRQGTLFSAPLARFSWNTLSDEHGDRSIIQKTRPTKPNEKFVLISQDCDIVASENDEPYAEAILCQLEKQRFVSRIGPKSARWFVIDHNIGLVAHAKYRTQFDKKILKSVKPEPWPNGSNRLDEFIRWLARRYDRPSIPDAIYEAFQRPLLELVAEWERQNPAAFAAFNKVVNDIRVNLPASEEPPFDLQLVLLVEYNGLSEEEADAINFFEESVRERIDQTIINLNPEMRILTEEEISLKEFYASRPIYVDDYTYRGEEIEGAPPHGRI